MKWLFNILWISILLLPMISGQTQNTNIRISGHVRDSLNILTLKYVPIQLLNQKDSIAVTSITTDRSGYFSINVSIAGSYLVAVRVAGYQPIYVPVECTKNHLKMDLGELYLDPAITILPSVIVTSSFIQLNNDTLVINAGKIGTNKNAVVEDLLKRVPGFQIDFDGTIKYKGQVIEKLLIDGNTFFGNNYLLASQNIPAEMIDKIKVYDTKNEQLSFSGVNDPSTKKTVDLTIKPNKKRGDFGKIETGIGTDMKYTAALAANHFDNSRQISAVSKIGNNNYQNLTQDNSNSNVPSAGVNTNGAFAFNFNDTWNKNTKISANYFYNSVAGKMEKQELTTNSYPNDYGTVLTQNQIARVNTQSNRLVVNIEEKIRQSDLLTVKSTITQSRSTSHSFQEGILQNGIDTVYASALTNNNTFTKLSGSIEGIYTHKFKKPHRSISFGINLSENTSIDSSRDGAINIFYVPKNIDTVQKMHHNEGNAHNIIFYCLYTEPLTNKASMEFLYRAKYNFNQAQTNTFNIDAYKTGSPLLDSLQSSNFENTIFQNYLSVKYKLLKPKCSLTIGTDIESDQMKNNDFTLFTTTTKMFNSLLPLAALNYKVSETKNWQITYQGRSRLPSIQQLQPVLKTVDSLNIITGNPNLKKVYTHNISIGYSMFNKRTEENIGITVSSAIIQNDIQNQVINLANGTQIMQPININENATYAVYVDYSIPIRKGVSQFSANTGVNLFQNHNLINQQENFNRTYIITQNATYFFSVANKYTISLTSNITYNHINYSLGNAEAHQFFTQQTLLDYSQTLHHSWTFSLNGLFYLNNSFSSASDHSILVITPSISKLFGKEKRLEMKFSVFDLFNENRNINNNLSNNSIQRISTNSVSRYAMLNAKYTFKHFKK
jgi:hypothetical protein